MTRYVLIGAGVASISAAEGIRALDSTGSIQILSDDPDGYYSRPGLAYFLTGEVDEKQLFPFTRQDLERLQARLVNGEVLRIDPAARQVVLRTGETFPYDRLLIATGATARALAAPGADLEGVFKLDHLDDARRIVRYARGVRSAVVVGGGITALELAEGIAAQQVKVHYLLRGKRFWAGVLDEVESELVETRLRHEGVALHHHSEVAEILGKKGRVTGVRLESGEQIECEMVAYAIGITPRAGLAREAGIRCDRGILVDEMLRTDQEAIYAAGDVAQVYDPVSGKFLLDSLWSSARMQGFSAGQNMAGKYTPYLKPAAYNVTRIAGLAVVIIGAVGAEEGRGVDIVRGDSESWHEPAQAVQAEQNLKQTHVRLMVGEDCLLGAVVIGAPHLSGLLLTLIRERTDISSIRAALLAPNAPIEQILLTFAGADPVAG